MAGHEELIKEGTFCNKFKNTLRDYYTYGFYSYQELQSESAQKDTIDNDWERLRNILSGQFEWSANKSRAFFLSADSQSMMENPFHKVYRFCRYNKNDPRYFFLTIFALSSDIHLKGGFEALKKSSEEALVRRARKSQKPDSKGEGKKERREDAWDMLFDVWEGNKLTASEILCFDPEKQVPFSGNYSGFDKRLKEWKNLGFLIKEEPKRVQQRWMHYWKLRETMPNLILLSGEAAHTGFAVHFLDALDFFSRYSPLGAVGSFLISRYDPEYGSAFRFKHAYFMQTLNDFHLIDLLDAMEQKKMCRIRYRKTAQSPQKEFVCKPIQIRISDTTGREYLIGYDLGSSCCTNLRMEYIDSVDLCAVGNPAEKIGGENFTAEKFLRHTWGVSPAGNRDNLRDVSLKIAWNPREEAFLLSRLKREKRIGKIQTYDDHILFTATVTDVREMLPWVRTFYSRLLDYSGIESQNYCMIKDLKSMLNLATGRETILPGPHPKNCALVQDLSDNGAGWQAHNMLFHEIFSIYYRVIADVLMRIVSESKYIGYTDEDIRLLVQAVLKKHRASLGEKTVLLLENDVCQFVKSTVFMESGYALYDVMPNGTKNLKSWHSSTYQRSGSLSYVRTYRSRFQTSKKDFYREILPLSLLERRWLRTILEDPKINLFLSGQEIAAVKACLDDVQALPIHCVHHMDRNNSDPQPIRQNKPLLQAVLDAIHQQKKVRLTFRDSYGNDLKGVYLPTVVEFSQRDSEFRIYLVQEKTQKVTTVNLSRITGAEILNDTYQLSAAREILQQYQSSRLEQLTIMFSDRKNTADRILNEFSPWRKRCTYDRNKRLYTMVLCYPREDYLEMVIRLLGFGPVIQIQNRESRVYREYVHRIRKQLSIEEGRTLAITTE